MISALAREYFEWEFIEEEEKDYVIIPSNLEDYSKYIGKRVRIHKDSMYYNEMSRRNPKDIDGVITEFFDDNDYIFVVIWDNKEYNHYRPKDLELI